MIKTQKLILFLCLITHIAIAHAYELEGKVVGISDGDTITVLDSSNKQFKVRLKGIDAPEKKQPFGTKSKQSLSGMIYMKQVTIEWNKFDRFDRILGKVRLGETDINLEQIDRGMAWYYKKYQSDLNIDDRLRYLDAEERAKDLKKGLWVDQKPVAPWNYRKR